MSDSIKTPSYQQFRSKRKSVQYSVTLRQTNNKKPRSGQVRSGQSVVAQACHGQRCRLPLSGTGKERGKEMRWCVCGGGGGGGGCSGAYKRVHAVRPGVGSCMEIGMSRGIKLKKKHVRISMKEIGPKGKKRSYLMFWI